MCGKKGRRIYFPYYFNLSNAYAVRTSYILLFYSGHRTHNVPVPLCASACVCTARCAAPSASHCVSASATLRYSLLRPVCAVRTVHSLVPPSFYRYFTLFPNFVHLTVFSVLYPLSAMQVNIRAYALGVCKYTCMHTSIISPYCIAVLLTMPSIASLFCILFLHPLLRPFFES